MKRGMTGRQEVFRTGDEEVRAFVPSPLPPDPPVDLGKAATGAVQTAQRLVTLFEHDGAQVRSRGRRAGAALRVFDALRARPVVSLNEACRRTGLTFPTATKGMAVLVDMSIARELTGQRRNRVFAYQSYLSILNEGTEPL